MRELTACIVILSLTLASGAPATEENKIHEKNYDFGDKEVLYSSDEIVKEFAYAVCEGSKAEKKCKVYLESLDPNVNFSYSCDVNLKYVYPYLKTLNIQNTGYKKVVFITRDGHNAKFIIMNMSSCQIKEATIEVTIKYNSNYPIPPVVFFVPHENNYDIIYRNSKLCQDYLCKTTLDYDGNVVKAASTFLKNGVRDEEILDIKGIDKNYLLRLFNGTQFKVSLIRNGEHDEKPFLVTGLLKSAATSTEENKIGFCYTNSNKFTCKQYDAEGKTKIFKADAKLGNDTIDIQSFRVLNLEKGLLAVIVFSYRQHPLSPARQGLVYFDEQGKQDKVINFDLKYDHPGDFLFLFKNAIGEPCVLGALTKPRTAVHHLFSNKFTFSTKCFTRNELVQV